MTIIDPLSPTGVRAVQGPTLQGSGGVGVTGAAEGADFTAMIGQLVSQAAATVRSGEAASIAGIQGNASVQQVVEAVMSAEQTLQGAIAIRDKVLSAYLELSRMSI